MPDRIRTLDSVNPKVPNAARIYDYLLGGKDNFAADRAAAEQLKTISGGDVVLGVRENRAWLRRAVRFLGREAGIGQFLDIGAGLPTQGNVHEIVRQVNPAARVVYVDNDPVVLTHGRAILSRDDRVAIVPGDLRRPAEILEQAEVRRLIDLEEPVGLLLAAVVHFVADTDRAAAIVRELRDALPAGSLLALSHGTLDAHPTTEGVGEVWEHVSSQFVPRTRAQVQALFDGFELVDPGVVWAPAWRPDDPAAVHEPQRAGMYAGVGRRT